jgi:retron-type reverse transcriptase
MKTYRHLYEKICSFENLHLAYLKARIGKRFKPGVLVFSANLEKELSSIRDDLIFGKYQVSPYRTFKIYEPKERDIMALPFRDRVIQHALVNIIEPIFEKRFIYDSHACRKGKGIHEASSRLTKFIRAANRTWMNGPIYCLKADIKKFYPSINRRILRDIIGRIITDDQVMTLIDTILHSSTAHDRELGKGLPIGNLISQLFANIYLNVLDHFIKDDLRHRFYIRYMDDFIILDSTRPQLLQSLVRIEALLFQTLDLSLNKKTRILQANKGIDFIGYKHWSDHRLLKKTSTIRVRRQLRGMLARLKDREITYERVHQTITSWRGYFKHADTHNLCKVLFQNKGE